MPQIDLQSALELLAAWLDIPSTSGLEATFLDHLERDLVALGYEVRHEHVAEGRHNLWARPSELPPGARSKVLFCTHIDTVPPHIPHRREGDRVYGRGAVDTKGGLVCMVAAAQALRARLGPAAIEFLLVVGEEVDHCGAKVAARSGRGFDHIILCEPTRAQLVSHQKGMVKVRLRGAGRAAHSAFPEEGVSALEPLLDALQRIREAAWPESDRLGATTVNIGRIEAGVAANVIPPHAEATLVFRVVGPCQTVIDQLRPLCEGLELEVLAEDEPQSLTVPPVERHGEPWPRTVVAFNTDAAFLSQLGPVTLVGPGDIRRAHSDDEHITVAELEDGIDFYTVLGEHLLVASEG